jgi:murein DD-endopeptidase MepM/ murein hydrolase activator NlpD
MQLPVPLLLLKYRHQFGPVVVFNQDDAPAALDLSGTNESLTPDVFNSTAAFGAFIQASLATAKASFGMGGYLENRIVYSRSPLFDGASANRANARTIHLGIDIWGKAGTPVLAPFGGTVHSFAFNNHFGDYGATTILQHQIDGVSFYTLYGHLSLADLRFGENQFINIGETIGHFGPPQENGHWPPHLHFQVIIDMQLKKGDYPGVCSAADLEFYQNNCPDPNLILNITPAAGNLISN